MDVEAVNENAVLSDVLTLMLQATPASGSEVIPREALKTNTMETDREAFMTAEADAWGVCVGRSLGWDAFTTGGSSLENVSLEL